MSELPNGLGLLPEGDLVGQGLQHSDIREDGVLVLRLRRDQQQSEKVSLRTSIPTKSVL